MTDELIVVDEASQKAPAESMVVSPPGQLTAWAQVSRRRKGVARHKGESFAAMALRLGGNEIRRGTQ